MKKTLEKLTEHEFNTLKNMGMLWEFYPDAPEFYNDIKQSIPCWGWWD